MVRLVDASRDGSTDPLRRRLADPSTTLHLSLAYQRPWVEVGKPTHFQHDFYIPSSADLVGTPADAPKCGCKGLLSLWALVNLQLDTWRGSNPLKDADGKTVDGAMDLQPLRAWLSDLAKLSDLNSFDGAVDKRSQALKDRAAKLAAFTEFRHEIQKPATLAATLDRLAKDRAQNAKECDDKWFKLLRTAAAPIGEPTESLTTAEIWLRYLFLLSYRGEGTLVVAGTAANGVNAYWKTCCPNCGEFSKKFPDATTPADQFARWHRMPAEGHFDRALHDATQAANGHAAWLAKLPILEQQRLAWLSRAGGPDEQYAAALRAHIADARRTDNSFLHAHLPAHPGNYLVASLDPKKEHFYNLHPLVGGQDLVQENWPNATAAERDRLVADLKRFAGEVRGGADLEQRTLDAQIAKPEELAERLRDLHTHVGGAEWDVTALPAKTFDWHQKQVKEALADFDKEMDRRQLFADLRDRYKLRRGEADIAEMEFAAARLGVEIAAKAKELAENLERVAYLNVQIKDHTAKAQHLIEEGKNATYEASVKRLEQAERLRDLAAAQVQALETAYGRAKEIVDKAVQDLNDMRPRLEEIAKKIEDSKRSSFLSILRVVVKIVGAALGPFTGGASVAIAAGVDQALAVVETLQQIDFGNLGQALGQVAEVASDAYNLTNGSIQQWGGKDLKKSWGDLKTKVDEAKGKAVSLAGDAQKLVAAVRNLPQEQLGRLAGAIDLKLPIDVDAKDGKIAVRFNSRFIRLKEKIVAGVLRDLLMNGGMIGVDQKLKELVKSVHFDKDILPQLDADLKKRLEQSIKETIRACPPEFRAEAHQAEVDLQAKVNGWRDQLLDVVKNGTNEQRRLLAQVLGGKLVAALEGKAKAVIAIDASAVGQAQQLFQDRLKAVAKSKVVKEIKALVDTIEGKKKVIEQAVKNAQDAKSEDAVREIAKSGISGTIDEIRGELVKLQDKITVAKGQVEDAQTGVEISEVDKAAAKKMAEAAEEMVKAGTLAQEEANLIRVAAGIQKDIANLQGEVAETKRQVAERRYAESRATLQRSYNDCLAWGINPFVDADVGVEDVPSLGEVFVVKKGDKHSGLFHGTRLRQASEGLVGMLQWMRLVGPALDEPDRVGQRITAHYGTILSIWNGTVAHSEQREKLEEIEKDVSAAVLGAKLPPPGFAKRAEANRGQIATWFADELTPEARDAAFADLPPRYRVHVMGRIRYRVSETFDGSALKEFAGVHVARKPPANNCFVPVKTVVTWHKPPANQANGRVLEFVVVPPQHAQLNTRELVFDEKGMSGLAKSAVLGGLNEEGILGEVQGLVKLWQRNVDLRGAIGDWTIYLLSRDENRNEADRKALASKWKSEDIRFDVYLPYVEFGPQR